MPLMEETFAWTLVFTWFFMHHVPVFSDFLFEVMSTDVSKKLFTVFFGIFRTTQTVGAIELASKSFAAEGLLAHSRFFSFVLAASVKAAFATTVMCILATRFGGVDLLSTGWVSACSASRVTSSRSAGTSCWCRSHESRGARWFR